MSKQTETAHLNAKVPDCNFQNIQHTLPCKTRNKMYSALILLFTWDT